MANKKVVYTAIFGRYDFLKNPLIRTTGWDYICFTDRDDLQSHIWKIIKIDNSKHGPIRSARRIKIMPHEYLDPKYQVSLWIDGSVEIKTNIDIFIDRYKWNGENIMITWHRGRQCIYDEANVCIRRVKDNKLTIEKQVAKYKAEGFPRKFGLVQTGIIFRRHSQAMQRFCKRWWHEVSGGSRRDQLSFNYVLWKTPDINIKLIDPRIFYNEFQLYSHSVTKRKKKRAR